MCVCVCLFLNLAEDEVITECDPFPCICGEAALPMDWKKQGNDITYTCLCVCVCVFISTHF